MITDPYYGLVKCLIIQFNDNDIMIPSNFTISFKIVYLREHNAKNLEDIVHNTLSILQINTEI